MRLAAWLRRIAVRLGLMRRVLPPEPGLFDADWYVVQAGGGAAVKAAPWRHYLEQGWRRGLSPSPLFDGGRYLKLYADVAAAGVEPLGHYVSDGWRERRSPHALFDAVWYAAQRQSEGDPLADYIGDGWRAGVSPHPLFDVGYYREGRGGMPSRCDLEDYLVAGWRAEVDPHPYFSVSLYGAEVAGEPLSYWVSHGCREDAAPHAEFDPAFYREAFLSTFREPPDPLVDFVMAGWVLGRKPRADAPEGWRDAAFAKLFRAGGTDVSSRP